MLLTAQVQEAGNVSSAGHLRTAEVQSRDDLRVISELEEGQFSDNHDGGCSYVSSPLRDLIQRLCKYNS